MTLTLISDSSKFTKAFRITYVKTLAPKDKFPVFDEEEDVDVKFSCNNPPFFN